MTTGGPGQTLRHSVQAAREAGPAPSLGPANKPEKELSTALHRPLEPPSCPIITRLCTALSGGGPWRSPCWVLGPSESGPFHGPRKGWAQTGPCCQRQERWVPYLLCPVASI